MIATSSKIPEHILDAIREAIDIADLIRQDIPLKKVGSDWKGKCPFHSEKTGSFNVNPSRGIYKCFGCDESGDAFKWLTDYRKMGFRDAAKLLAEKVGIPLAIEPALRKAAGAKRPHPTPARKPNPAPPEAILDHDDDVLPWERKRRPRPPRQAFNWNRCVKKMVDHQIARMVTERGYRREFVEFLVSHQMVGIYNGGFAFPVYDGGEVIRCHYRTESGWAYSGAGKSVPWVFGDIENAAHITVHESQWDALAMADKMLWDEDPREVAFIVTRGATAKCDMSEFRVPRLVAIPQNDPDTKKNTKGLTPAEEWLEAVSKTRAEGTAIVVGKIPEGIKDLNDWTRDHGATAEDVRAKLLDGARSGLAPDRHTAGELRRLKPEPGGDPDCLIGTKRRFLCRGGSGLFIGPAGIGKSTLISSITTHWAAGVPWQGINVRRPLRVLVIQAENDQGDAAEMIDAAFESLEKSGDLTRAEIERAECNIEIVTENERTGRDWTEWLEAMIRETGADLVVADPLLSYIGDDISQQKPCSIFLRNHLQPVLHRTGAMILFVHHTGKTSSDSKARAHWSASDFSYIGIGSSELTNWPRAIMTILPTNEDGVFKFSIPKRGGRAGMTSGFADGSVTSVFLAHSTNGGLGWTEVAEPERPAKDSKRERKVLPEHVVGCLPMLGSCERGMLTGHVMRSRNAGERTVRAAIAAVIGERAIHVETTGPRPGGGKPLEYLARGPKPE